MGVFSKTIDYFGLDIGTTAIRLVYARSGGTHPPLVTYGQIPMPPGLAASDSIVDRDKIAELVAQLVKDTRVPTKSVVVGLPSSKIYASIITTPKLDQAQLAKAIKYQAEQYVPMAVDQVKLDWSVIDQSPDGKSIDVLLVAAPNTVVTKYAEIMDKAGLDILAVEPSAVAAARALVTANNIAVVVIDFSTLDSDVTIISAGMPRLLRSINVGSQTFVRAVAQNLGLDEIQAEQFAYKFGLTQSKLEGQVYKAIKPSLDSLVAEIGKSIKFFGTKYAGVKLEKLVITGHASTMPELATYLATALNLPVEYGNAWGSMSVPSGAQDELSAVSKDFAAAVGLAARMYLP